MGKDYRKTLTVQQAVDGINCIVCNSKRLLEDAEFLLTNNRDAASVVLAVASIEEISKARMILDILVCKSDAKLKELWRNFYSHKIKNVGWMGFALAAKLHKVLQSDDGKIEDISISVFSEKIKHISEILEEGRLGATYVDFSTENNWSEPVKDIDDDFVDWVLDVARAVTNVTETNEEMVRLWLEMAEPNTNSERAQHAFNCFQEKYNKENVKDVTGMYIWTQVLFFLAEEKVNSSDTLKDL